MAEALKQYAGQEVVVYALPRGGVVLGAEIARRLRAPLDLIITRKIGHPFDPEYAIAAVTEKGDLVGNEKEISRLDPEWFRAEVAAERAEAERRRKRYLESRPTPSVRGKVAILVDDGLATGLTMKAAVKELRHREPREIVIAVPVAPAETVRELAGLVERMVALRAPEDFLGAIGAYYDDFPQVTDQQVADLLLPWP